MGGKMADILKDGLLLGGGIHYVAVHATRGSKQFPTCICDIV